MENPSLKFPLTSEEISKVDAAYDLLEIMTTRYYFVQDFRKHTIKKIRKMYSIEEFSELEDILNKLFWNVRWIVAPMFIGKDVLGDEIPYSLSLCHKSSYTTKDDLYKKIQSSDAYQHNFFRSSINKIFIVDKSSSTVYMKQMEGDSGIFGKNEYNALCARIFCDKNLCKAVITDPSILITTNVLKDFQETPVAASNLEFDYGFPNLNMCSYSTGGKKFRREKIKRMYYYNKNGKVSDKWWKKLLV